MNLERFIEAQDRWHDNYADALAQIKRGYKAGHWIWYIFPQIKGLGHSYNSNYYGLDGLEEAREYLSDPILRERLLEITQALLNCDNEIEIIMGSYIDAMKLKSSMTLFKAADSSIDLFERVLVKFFNGAEDETTLELLKEKN